MATPPKVEDDKDIKSLERTKAIMAEMLRMPPKPHSEMKIGKRAKKPIRDDGAPKRKAKRNKEGR